MLFNSWEFIGIFLPITLGIYFLLARKEKIHYKLLWLVGTSIFFYSWWNPNFLPVLAFSIIFNYSLGIILYKNSGLKQRSISLGLLIMGISINLGLLGYFKYAIFFKSILSGVVNDQFQLHSVQIPLGISFFTFQQIVYLVEAYGGLFVEGNFLVYSCFVSFFPQLIAGPIVRPEEIIPQIKKSILAHEWAENILVGLSIFVIGLFKKVVIADSLSEMVSPVFSRAEQGEVLDFFSAWGATFGYTFQLYFDFSGYADMAIGLGKCFGIKVPLNFNSPYKAFNIIEFWRCWHITLSRFLKDFLYIPLGGSKNGRTRKFLNLFLTMTIAGFWHGAGWTFVFWGALHGGFLIVNHAWNNIWRRKINSWWSILLSRMVTILCIALGWVFFRAETFAGASHIFKGMMNLPYTISEKYESLAYLLEGIGFSFTGPWISENNILSVVWLIFWLGFLWFMPNTQELFRQYKPAFDSNNVGSSALKDLPVKGLQVTWDPGILWGIYIGLLAAVALLSLSRTSEFLYFQF